MKSENICFPVSSIIFSMCVYHCANISYVPNLIFTGVVILIFLTHETNFVTIYFYINIKWLLDWLVIANAQYVELAVIKDRSC